MDYELSWLDGDSSLSDDINTKLAWLDGDSSLSDDMNIKLPLLDLDMELPLLDGDSSISDDLDIFQRQHSNTSFSAFPGDELELYAQLDPEEFLSFDAWLNDEIPGLGNSSRKQHLIGHDVWIDPITGARRQMPCGSECGYRCSTYLEEEHFLLVNPRTCRPLEDSQEEDDQEHMASPDVALAIEEKEIKPYHPSQDHDYPKSIVEDKILIEEEENEDEPDVDVWDIEDFGDQEVPLEEFILASNIAAFHQTSKRETRGISSRAVNKRRREHAQRLSKAVRAVLNTPPKTVKQYKRKLPKNSVETTPSQSDIEEWSSQPVAKTVKKKTVKGRKDHSQSERQRREVLRINFQCLKDLIPMNFLRGDKASSQISKQKILTGAKSFILEILQSKLSYGSMYDCNGGLRRRIHIANASRIPKSSRRRR